MSEVRVLSTGELLPGAMKTVTAGHTEVLLVHHESGICAVQPTCPHAGAPLADGAICNGRLICPWHMGTFALPGGELLEPPPLAPLRTYAVRTDGINIFVDPGDVFLLAGAGAANVSAAATLRLNGYQGRLIVVDPVADEPVDRTQLSKDALGGKMPLDKIRIDAFAGFDVERLEASVNAISASRRQITLSDGKTIKFDKALIATGGEPKRLTIPGAELAHTIRHSADVQRISLLLEKKQDVVILGSSFIGLEAASALVQKGLKVTVAAREKLPFVQQFGEAVAGVLKKMHEDGGTRFRLGVDILRIEKDQVTVREHGEETRIPADLVIMGVGVTPKLDFEHDLPLASEGGGIRADETLRVHEGVWVAGDIANVNGTRIEHWRVAQQQGHIAALGMLGLTVPEKIVPYFWTYHFSKRIGYLGHAAAWDEIHIEGDLNSGEFLVFYVSQGRVEAALNCGRESQMAALAELMRDQPSLQKLLQKLRL